MNKKADLLNGLLFLWYSKSTFKEVINMNQPSAAKHFFQTFQEAIKTNDSKAISSLARLDAAIKPTLTGHTTQPGFDTYLQTFHNVE